jgi:hypothetical protein
VLTTPYVLPITNSCHIRVIVLTSALEALRTLSVCLSVCTVLLSDNSSIIATWDQMVDTNVLTDPWVGPSAHSRNDYTSYPCFLRHPKSTNISEIFGSSGPDIQVRARDSPTSQLRKSLSDSLSLTYTYSHSTPGLSSSCAEL